MIRRCQRQPMRREYLLQILVVSGDAEIEQVLDWLGKPGLVQLAHRFLRFRRGLRVQWKAEAAAQTCVDLRQNGSFGLAASDVRTADMHAGEAGRCQIEQRQTHGAVNISASAA